MKAGALVCADSTVQLDNTRNAFVNVQASWDGGMTFSAWTIDVSSIWGNGGAVEVEKDVVLVVYGGPNTPDQLRTQRVRIIHDPRGLLPA